MDTHRELAAIVFTDIVGYTSLMSKNEEMALEVLEENRRIHHDSIKRHGGRFIKEIGDGNLAIFPTASEAVASATDILEQLSGYELRIGIHLAEIVLDATDIFGDGVNIASRIESIAPAGGIYVSEPVFNSIRSLGGVKHRYEGEILFKNVESPIKIFAIGSQKVPFPDKYHFRKRKDDINRKASRKKLVRTFIASIIVILLVGSLYQLNVFNLQTFGIGEEKDKTIAVLPFEYMGPASEEDYISVGITEDVLNHLLKIENLKIIDRSNLRMYQFKDKSFKEIGRELQVSSLLIGTVSKDDDEIRITAKLIDTATEEILWQDIYQKPFADVFQIQNEVAVSIAKALRVTVTDVLKSGLKITPTSNMNAYDLYLKGKEYYSRYTESDNLSAIELFHQALQLDPDFVLAHAGLSDAFSQLAQKSNVKELWLDSAFYYASVVQKVDPASSSGYKSMGLYYSIIGESQKAIKEFEQAVAIDDNVEAKINLSRLYFRSGQLEKSLSLLNDAQWYHPMNADMWFNFGATYYRLQDYGKSEEYIEKSLFINPNHINSLLLKWFIAVLTKDNENSFTVAQKLGVIGNDDTDKLLIVLQKVIQERMIQTEDPANVIMPLLENREVDYIEIPYLYNLICYIYFNGGLRDRADTLIQYKIAYNMERMNNGDISYKFPYELAQVYAIRGDNDEAILYLNKALQNGWMEYSFASTDPSFFFLQSDKRFNEIIQKSIYKLDSIQLQVTTLSNSKNTM
jgi:adenylate cyclase